MACFMAERYLASSPIRSLLAVVARDRLAARIMTTRGVPISHLRTIYMPEDEMYFSLFEAPSARSLQEVSDRLDLGFVRITEAMQIGPEVGTEPRPRS